MFRLVSTFLVLLFFGSSSWCQSVYLEIEINDNDSIFIQKLKFDSFNDAEASLDFKIDSLIQLGHPFLNQTKEIKNKTLLSKIQLNQRIDFIFLTIEEEYLSLLPKSSKVIDNTVEIAYSDIDIFLNTIILNLKKEGSPFGKTSLVDINFDSNHSITANLSINKGQKRIINKINVKGYPELSKTYITRFSNLKTGKKFVESEIQTKTEKLNNIPFVSIKKPTEVLFKKDSTELFVYLEKVNANTFDGFLGFGSNETSDFQLNGYLNMVLLNNLNFGERLGIIYKNDGIGQQTFEGNIDLPFLFKSPVSLDAGLRIFRRDSSFSNSSQLLNLNYQLNDKLSANAGIEFTNSTNIEPEGFTNNNVIEGFNSSFYGVGLNYINLKNNENFDEHTIIKLKTYLGNRTTNTSTDQYKLTLQAQHQIDLNFRNRIYLNLNSQVLISDNYINNELFRFGGVNSIRGFGENSLIGNRYTVLQTEYRYLLDANLFANTVLDIGNFENKLDNVNENILGYGIGLGLKSKAGIFQLILANAVSSFQEATFANSKIHIGFTSFF